MLCDHGLHETHQTRGESNETVDGTHFCIKLPDLFIYFFNFIFSHPGNDFFFFFLRKCTLFRSAHVRQLVPVASAR